MLGRLWKYVTDALDGLKTLLVAGTFILLGLAEYTEVVDVKPVLTYLFGEDRAGVMMILMPVVFGTLRFLSNGGVKWTPKWNQDKALADGDGHSVVDTPASEKGN